MVKKKKNSKPTLNYQIRFLIKHKSTMKPTQTHEGIFGQITTQKPYQLREIIQSNGPPSNKKRPRILI
jgi:hypothetical protein